jgi:hypothetical protein
LESDEELNQAERTVIQISVFEDGRFMLRGPRLAVDELLSDFAKNGLLLDLGEIQWCG